MLFPGDCSDSTCGDYGTCYEPLDALHFYVFVTLDGLAINALLILMTACPIPATMTEVVPMGLICFLANAQNFSLAKNCETSKDL